MPDETVTHWIERLQAGDADAARPLWERYFHRLVGLARARLQARPRLADEAEDVALSAFASFCRHAEAGRFPDLRDRDDLWRLLVTLTARKAAHLARDRGRQKRGGDAAEAGSSALDGAVGEEPTPEFAASVAEEYERLLAALDSHELRLIALQKLEGYTNGEIAASLGVAPSTVDRRLALIRRIWEREGLA